MNLDPGWNLDPKQLLRLQLLEALASVPMGRIPHVSALRRRANDTEYTDDDYIKAMQEFDGLGFIDHYQRGHGIINAVGRSALERIDSVRNDRRQRNRQVLDAILYWLEEQTANGQTNPVISKFTTTPYGLWFGEPFPEDEVNRATLRLKEEGYIRGRGATGAGVIRPTITPEGQRLVESGRSVHDDPQAASGAVTNNIHQYGDNAIAQAAGHGASLSVATLVTDDHRQQALHLADAVAQAHASLSPQAGVDVETLRAAVAPGQDDPGVVRAALQSIKTTLSTGTGDIVGKLILGGFGGLLAHYGIPLG